MGNTTTFNDPDTQALLTGKNVSLVYTVDPVTNKPYGISGGGGGGGGGGAVTDLSTSGTLTAAQSTEQTPIAGGTVSLNLGTGQSSFKVELVALAGFTSATTIVIDGSVDGTNWLLKAFKVAGSLTTTSVQSVVGPGPLELTGNCAGLQKIRVRCTVLNSGETITVTLIASVGVGDVGLLSSIPTGTNTIGGVKVVDGAGTNQLAIDAAGKVGINSLPAITEANSAAIKSDLDTVVTNTGHIPANGQAAMAASIPVALASDQTPQTSSTATKTSVNSAASDTALLASNTSRKGVTFYNDSTAILYLSYGSGAATTSSYTLQVPSQATYELPPQPIYTGAIRGIWASANGAVRITELS